MYQCLKHLKMLPRRVLLCDQPSRMICATEPRWKLDKGNLYDKFKFEFTEQNLSRANDLINCYPEAERRGALLPLMDLAQRQYGWLPISAIVKVAEMLKVEPFAAWEVANYYTMFALQPLGRFRLKVCITTPCFLRGSDEILETCKRVLNLEDGETSKDMQFTLQSTYCQGACVNAPSLTVNDDIYEDLTVEETEKILCSLKEGIMPPAGPRGRCACEPKPGLTSLTNEPPPSGYCMQDLCAAKKRK